MPHNNKNHPIPTDEIKSKSFNVEKIYFNKFGTLYYVP